MLALAGQGAAEGLWLRAERQTGGRGRMGRAWESPTGNLHCSTIVRLMPGDPPPPSLALAAALATWDAVEALAPGRSFIKWPNDIMAGQGKLSGMLLERSGNAVVIGIGMNVLTVPEVDGRVVTSLHALGVTHMSAGDVLGRLAGCFAERLHIWRTYGLAPIIAGWTAAAHPKGTPLTVTAPDGETIEGRFSALDTDGAMILDLANGGARVIHAGDVFLV
jgi:BirA family biotin operon repressor/biotin-[acetyl-CoA-carboxylase] ligase